MGYARDERVAVNAQARPEELGLSPQEYFVLSRAEHVKTVGELLAVSGLDPRSAEQVVRKLVELGAVTISPPAPKRLLDPTPRGTPSWKDQAKLRRRKLLQQQMGRARQSPPPEPTTPTVEPEPDDGTPLAPEARAPRPQVDGRDRRIVIGAPIAVDDQRWLLAAYDQVAEMDPFAFLGLRPTHDLQEIRRAYHETSRQMHPDAYYGKELGGLADILSVLFRRAKSAYAQLQKPEVRAPFVDQAIALKARMRAEQDARTAAARAEAAADAAQREEEAAQRRRQRDADRLRRRRDEIIEGRAAEAQSLFREAAEAQEAGRMAKAANLFRLVLRYEPDNDEARERWESCRGEARRVRAADAFEKAMTLVNIGAGADAANLFVEAAEADPKATHLARAADAIRGKDAAKARQFALMALDAIGVAEASDTPYRPADVGRMHVFIGRAFLAAGQKKSAKQQASMAQKLIGDDPDVRALLNSIKLT